MTKNRAPRPQDAMHPVHFSRKLFGDLKDFLALPRAERWFLTAAWIIGPAVSAALSRYGFERFLKRLPQPGNRDSAKSSFLVDVERGETLVRIAFRRHPNVRAGCLPESLTQYLLHSVVGPTPKIVIGVKRTAVAEVPKALDGLDWMIGAHAWVEPDRGPRREIEFAPIVACSARSGIWKAEGTSP